MLAMRNLETMKRSSSAAKLAARNDPSKKPKQLPEKIPKTGVFAPEQLGNIAATLKASKAEFEQKRPHVCQVPRCTKRYVFRSGLETHMKSEHPGVPIMPALAMLRSKVAAVVALEAEFYSDIPGLEGFEMLPSAGQGAAAAASLEMLPSAGQGAAAAASP